MEKFSFSRTTQKALDALRAISNKKISENKILGTLALIGGPLSFGAGIAYHHGGITAMGVFITACGLYRFTVRED